MHGGLGGVVRRLPLRPVDDLRRDRADVDDHAAVLRDHLPAELLAAVPDAVDVDVHHEIATLRCDLKGGPVDAGAGVVHQHVDLAEPIDDLPTARSYLVRLGDVGASQRSP